MSLSRVHRVTMTIPSGSSVSNVLSAWNTFGGSAGLMIYSPASLPETVNIEVSPDTANVPTSWFDIQDGDPVADLVVPGAGKALFFERLVLANHIRLVSTTNVGADRIFQVTFQAIYK